ncbi:LPS-assembly protein LptD [Poriferisphaera corsica]|uniref:LPS-assembly protein LptD n=1 Tax=Poriferisphaera corsica TaxID=2528020 RepID=A0A517YWP4_9BACT|nr:LPS assembly protein LptD [Poriferisphaera corsica]QDU34622.1 LPS-assembly protein LptD [Poriferisphaera corsica]
MVTAPQLAEICYAQQDPGRYEGVIDEVEGDLKKKPNEESFSELEDLGAPTNLDARQFSDLEAPYVDGVRTNTPLGEPVLSLDVNLAAKRTRVWNEGGNQVLLLEEDVKFWVGAYSFRAKGAVVRVATESLPGREIKHVAVYLDHATPGNVPGSLDGPVVASARKLLVTVSSYGKMKLLTDLMQEGVEKSELVEKAETRFARYDASQEQVLERTKLRPVFSPEQFAIRNARRKALGVEISEADKEFIRLANAQLEHEVLSRQEIESGDREIATIAKPEVAAARRERIRALEGASPEPAILPAQGSLSYGPIKIFSSQQIGEPGSGQRALMFLGGVDLTYEDYARSLSVSLRAQKAVIIIDENKLRGGDDDEVNASVGGELAGKGILGIYLENSVQISDGDYTIRAPRVYYDLMENKALVLDAVMYTYDDQMKLPLYVRAEALRQTSANSWNAEEARFTTSEFGEPHFAIAAGEVTIDRRETPGGTDRYFLASKHNRGEVFGTPLVYFPYIAGEYYDVPLRDVRGGFNSRFGLFFETGWDMFSLFGKEKPENVDAVGKLGYLGVHNLSLGLDADYDTETMYGEFKSYMIPIDGGEDVLGEGRRDVNRSGDTRGFETWKHRQYLPDNIELSLQASWVSDNTFLEEFFPREAYEAQQYQASGYVKTNEDNWLVSGVAKTNLNSFTPQLTYLQAPGYVVDKLPEIQATTAPFTLFNETVNWYSQSSLSRMRVRAGTDTPESRGFEQVPSEEIFGIPPNQTFKSYIEGLGVPTNYVLRADTRHELSMPVEINEWLNFVPYVVGRVTAYDRTFEEFNDGNGANDTVRLWGMVGGRLNTEFSKVWTTRSNPVLNTNGIRHVFEPYMNIWTVGTTIQDQDLPIFDYDVERIDQGTGVAVGARNTLQTKRGGPGRWRDVDWIMWDARYVQRWDEGFPEFRIPRYYNYHPEYSIGGSHFYSELLWMVSDNVAMMGELTWGNEFDEVVQWRVNGTINHTPRFGTFVNYEEIPVLSSRLLTYGFTYRLATKYMVHFLQRLDLDNDESRRIGVNLDRKLPRFVFRVNVILDVVDNEQLFNVQLIPDGLGGQTNWAATPLQF